MHLNLAMNGGNGIVIMQIDLEQAFDRLRHSAILKALYAKGASKELMVATCTHLNGLRCRVRLGNTLSDWVQQDHGVPQSIPESPAMLVHTIDLMQALMLKWENIKSSGSSQPTYR